MAVFAFAFFACMLAFIDANDVAENQIAGMYNILFNCIQIEEKLGLGGGTNLKNKH